MTDTERKAEFDRLRAEYIGAIRKRIAEIRAKRGESRRVEPDPAPRYDAVFWEGVAWLDTLECEVCINNDEHSREVQS